MNSVQPILILCVEYQSGGGGKSADRIELKGEGLSKKKGGFTEKPEFLPG